MEVHRFRIQDALGSKNPRIFLDTMGSSPIKAKETGLLHTL